ncbi:MAG: DUF2141 domain-containing protein [Spirochaetes bacterium]|nr:DUF2141 domain-containing protein [Spirochaetota bacterium]
MKMMIICIKLSFLLQGILFAGSVNYTVSGKIDNIKNNAPVYILLTDEETSKMPFAGIRKIIIDPDDKALKNGYVEFIFKNIPQGVYGIRCFQDINGNSKLDKGLFGPKEPWGLSWNMNKTSGWPSFENYSFLLNEDIPNLTITLK